MATITFTQLGLTGQGTIFQTGPESFYKPNAFITVSSANDITLTNPLASVIRAEFSASGKHLILPPMNVTNSRQAGETIFIVNDAANSFDLYANDNSTLIYPDVQTNQWILLNITDNADANGGFFPLPIGTLAFQNSSNVSVDALLVSGGSQLTSVFLPTTGGTASSLNYYEENSYVTNVSGIWASPISRTISWTRIGKIVTLSIPETLATANTPAQIAFDTALPTQIRPSLTIQKPILVRDNGAANQKWGAMQIFNDGTVAIGVDANNAVFAGTGSSGLRFLNKITYSI